jgi:hypothetical protein
VLNAAVTIALITAMAAGLRPPSLLDFEACAGPLVGFLNAVGDLIEAEGPIIDDARETIRLEGLEAFRSER